jgi:TonB family protein
MIDSAAFFAESVRGLSPEGPLFDGELLIVFDSAGRVRETRIVESPDTPDLMPALIAAVNLADAARTFPHLPSEVPRATTPVRIRLFGTRSTLPPPTDSAASVVTIAEPSFVVSLTDVQALPIAGYGTPRYPAVLKSNWITGEATLQFIVDATGRAVARSARTVYTSHPDFAMATREALPQMRFQPALVGKCPVASWVRQKFEFRLGSSPPS